MKGDFKNKDYVILIVRSKNEVVTFLFYKKTADWTSKNLSVKLTFILELRFVQALFSSPSRIYCHDAIKPNAI